MVKHEAAEQICFALQSEIGLPFSEFKELIPKLVAAQEKDRVPSMDEIELLVFGEEDDDGNVDVPEHVVTRFPHVSQVISDLF
jgi:hypothetical protein